MNRGMNLGVRVDDEFDGVEVDINVDNLTPHEMLSLFGVLTGYVLRDFSKSADDSDVEESFELMTLATIETYTRLLIDDLIDDVTTSSDVEMTENEHNDVKINYDVSQMDNAINKILEDFENGR